MGDLAHGAGPCRSLSGLQPDRRVELERQAPRTAGPAGPGEAVFPAGQVESQSIAAAAFSRSCNSGGMVRASQLARADDAGDALREALWRELAAYLLRRRSPGACQPTDAARHLGSPCYPDRAKLRWNPGDDRCRNAAELDQHRTRATAPVDAADRAHYSHILRPLDQEEAKMPSHPVVPDKPA